MQKAAVGSYNFCVFISIIALLPRTAKNMTLSVLHCHCLWINWRKVQPAEKEHSVAQEDGQTQEKSAGDLIIYLSLLSLHSSDSRIFPQ